MTLPKESNLIVFLKEASWPIGWLIAVILWKTARVPFGQDTRDTRRWQWIGFTCFTSTPLIIYIFILMDYGSPKVPQVFQAKHCELLEGFPFLFKNLTACLVEVLNMTMAGGVYLFETKTIVFIFIIFVRFVLSSIFGDWCGAIPKLRNFASRGVDRRITRFFLCLASHQITKQKIKQWQQHSTTHSEHSMNMYAPKAIHKEVKNK